MIKLFCRNGHSVIEDSNVYIRKSDGARYCKKCLSDRRAAARAAWKAAGTLESGGTLPAEVNRPLPKGTVRAYCVKGMHALIPENVYIEKATGHRYCKECRKDRRRINGTTSVRIPTKLVQRISVYLATKTTALDNDTPVKKAIAAFVIKNIEATLADIADVE